MCLLPSLHIRATNWLEAGYYMGRSLSTCNSFKPLSIRIHDFVFISGIHGRHEVNPRSQSFMTKDARDALRLFLSARLPRSRRGKGEAFSVVLRLLHL